MLLSLFVPHFSCVLVVCYLVRHLLEAVAPGWRGLRHSASKNDRMFRYSNMLEIARTKSRGDLYASFRAISLWYAKIS
jgi:hypothetical protein